MKRVNINRHQLKATLTKALKRILQVSILPLFVVFSLIIVLPSLPAYA